MQSLYQHLVSLLFVFSSLQLQLADGCSCALTHPQDAYCNSDIDAGILVTFAALFLCTLWYLNQKSSKLVVPDPVSKQSVYIAGFVLAPAYIDSCDNNISLPLVLCWTSLTWLLRTKDYPKIQVETGWFMQPSRR